MNNLLTTPIGVDFTIQSFQVDLYRELAKVWSGDIDGYGRVEKVPVNKGDGVPDYYKASKIITPEWFNSVTRNYEEVFYNDKKSCVFCFIKDDIDRTEDEQHFTTKSKCVFMVDLSKIYPNDTERVTSKAHRDAMEIFRNFGFNKFEIKSIEQRIETIFFEYSTTNIKFNDMHPLHCFAITMDLEYFLTDKCT